MTRQFEEDKPQRRADDRSSHSLHDCAYEANGMRCKYLGSWASNKSGPWYCSAHASERNTSFADQVLQESQIPPRRSPPQPNDDLKDLDWLNENFPMQPGETRQEYNMRCKDKALSMLSGFRPKSVVNTDPGPQPASQPQRSREPGEDMVEW